MKRPMTEAEKKAHDDALKKRMEFDMDTPEGLLELMATFSYNLAWATEALGYSSRNSIRDRLRRAGVYKKVGQLRKQYVTKWGNQHRQSISQIKDQGRARVRALEQDERFQIHDSDARALLEQFGQEKIETALIASYGVITTAAKLLACQEAALMRLVSRDDTFSRAIQRGRKELQLKLQDKTILAAQGLFKPTASEAKFIAQVLKNMPTLKTDLVPAETPSDAPNEMIHPEAVDLPPVPMPSLMEDSSLN